MAFPQIREDLFENSGAGPLLRRDVLPLAGPDENGDQQLGAVKVDGVSIRFNDDGELETDALPVLTLLWEPSSLDKPGFLRANINQGLLTRDSFPEAAAEVQRRFDAGDSGVVTETAWQTEYAANGMCGKFSIGDGSTTFRIPFFGVSRAALAVVGTGLDVGEYREDQMRPITGEFDTAGQTPYSPSTAPTPSGAFAAGQGRAYPASYRSDMSQPSLLFDSARLGANYSGDITHGPLVGATPYIKMYGTVTEASEANIAALIAASTGKLDRSEYQAQRDADRAEDALFKIKAWATISSAATILAAENITSVTRTATGQLTIYSPAINEQSCILITAVGVGSYATGNVNKMNNGNAAIITLNAGSSATYLNTGVNVIVLGE